MRHSHIAPSKLSVHGSWAKFCIRFRPQLSLSSVTASDLHYLNTMYANGTHKPPTHMPY